MPAGLYQQLLSKLIKLEQPTLLGPATRHRLEEHFAPEVEQLEVLLGRDLSDWRAS